MALVQKAAEIAESHAQLDEKVSTLPQNEVKLQHEQKSNLQLSLSLSEKEVEQTIRQLEEDRETQKAEMLTEKNELEKISSTLQQRKEELEGQASLIQTQHEERFKICQSDSQKTYTISSPLPESSFGKQNQAQISACMADNGRQTDSNHNGQHFPVLDSSRLANTRYSTGEIWSDSQQIEDNFASTLLRTDDELAISSERYKLSPNLQEIQHEIALKEAAIERDFTTLDRRYEAQAAREQELNEKETWHRNGLANVENREVSLTEKERDLDIKERDLKQKEKWLLQQISSISGAFAARQDCDQEIHRQFSSVFTVKNTPSSEAENTIYSQSSLPDNQRVRQDLNLPGDIITLDGNSYDNQSSHSEIAKQTCDESGTNPINNQQSDAENICNYKSKIIKIGTLSETPTKAELRKILHHSNSSSADQQIWNLPDNHQGQDFSPQFQKTYEFRNTSKQSNRGEHSELLLRADQIENAADIEFWPSEYSRVSLFEGTDALRHVDDRLNSLRASPDECDSQSVENQPRTSAEAVSCCEEILQSEASVGTQGTKYLAGENKQVIPPGYILLYNRLPLLIKSDSIVSPLPCFSHTQKRSLLSNDAIFIVFAVPRLTHDVVSQKYTWSSSRHLRTDNNHSKTVPWYSCMKKHCDNCDLKLVVVLKRSIGNLSQPFWLSTGKNQVLILARDCVSFFPTFYTRHFDWQKRLRLLDFLVTCLYLQLWQKLISVAGAM